MAMIEFGSNIGAVESCRLEKGKQRLGRNELKFTVPGLKNRSAERPLRLSMGSLIHGFSVLLTPAKICHLLQLEEWLRVVFRQHLKEEGPVRP